MSAKTRAYLPWIALLVVWIVWGSTYSAIRIGVETIPPYLMIGVRYVIAGLALCGLQYAFASPKPKFPSRSELIRIAITGVLLLVIGNGFLAYCETRVPSGNAALLVACMPIWMLVLEAIRTRKMIGAASVAGLVIGSAGIALLVGEQSGHANGWYAAMLVFGAFSWALGTVYSRAKADHHPLSASLEMTIGGAIAIAVGLATGEGAHFSMAAVSAGSLYGMLWLITAGAMVGYTAYNYIVRTLPAPTVATYAYVNPVVAVILGVLLLHEPVTWNLIAGGVAVVVSVAVILLGNRKLEQELDDATEVAA